MDEKSVDFMEGFAAGVLCATLIALVTLIVVMP